jgi:hypothetical protein
MRITLAAAIVLVVVLGGTVMGIAAMFLVPLIASIAVLALLIWFVQRRTSNKPPIR